MSFFFFNCSCLRDFSYFLGFQQLEKDTPRWFCVCIFVFIPLGILWVSWICGLVFIPHFGKCSAIISSNISLAPFSFSSGISIMHILDHLISTETVGCYILIHAFFFLLHFFWGISIDLYSSSLIPSLSVLSLLMSPWKTIFISIIMVLFSSISILLFLFKYSWHAMFH